MALLRSIDPDTATDDTRRMFDALHRSIGRVPAMMRLMAQSPAILDTYLHFNHALERTTLSPKTKVLITVAVAELNSCDYTLSLGMALGRRQGVADADLDLARTGRSADTKISQTLAFATSIVRNRGHVASADVERLNREGFSEAEIVDIIAAVALNLFRNYFNLVLGTDIDSPVVRSRQSEQLA